jgi:squalene-hopene/tetraprenyl-beta-curcumene cyclase
MTYAGIKSFIYARLDRDDPRVQKAYQWICKNYTLDENPGMASDEDPDRGKQGLYYYYRTMAKALLLWGESTVPTPDGPRRWAVDLGRKLLALQKEDGTWRNEADRWWEALPEISTSYALLALADVTTALTQQPSRLAGVDKAE